MVSFLGVDDVVSVFSVVVTLIVCVLVSFRVVAVNGVFCLMYQCMHGVLTLLERKAFNSAYFGCRNLHSAFYNFTFNYSQLLTSVLSRQ